MEDEDQFDMVPVSSSQIASVGYKPESQTMRVEFNGGQLYEYDAVPQNVADNLKQAPSVGSYFHSVVKNGGYSYRRLS